VAVCFGGPPLLFWIGRCRQPSEANIHQLKNWPLGPFRVYDSFRGSELTKRKSPALERGFVGQISF